MVLYFDDIFFSFLHTLMLAIVIPVLCLTYLPFMILKSKFEKRRKEVAKSQPWQSYDVKRAQWSTQYIEMSDGVKIAVDVWLPSQNGIFPVVINSARYHRSTRVWWPFSYLLFKGKPFSLLDYDVIKGFLAEGVAVVFYDVRGTGASFGCNKYPWWPREREDSSEIIDWVLKQSFSNKKIGLFGASYGGSAAFHHSLLTAKSKSMKASHKNIAEEGVVAVAALYSFWDVYRDLVCPGGVELECFPIAWAAFCKYLDLDRLWMTGVIAFLLFEGVTPVPTSTESGRISRRKARSEHFQNWDPTKDSITFRDDPTVQTGLTSAQFSPQGSLYLMLRSGELLPSLLPTALQVTGWFDTSAGSSIIAFDEYPSKTRYLVIGPWTHSANQHVRTFGNLKNTVNPFGYADLLRWFMAQQLKVKSDESYRVSNISSNRDEQPASLATPEADESFITNLNDVHLDVPVGARNASSSDQISDVDSLIVRTDHNSFRSIDVESPLAGSVHNSEKSNRSGVTSLSVEFSSKDRSSDRTGSRAELADTVLPGTATAKEIAAKLSPQTPVAYYVMQAEVWKITRRIPLEAARISFSLISDIDSDEDSSSLKELNKKYSLKPCEVAPNPDELQALREFVTHALSKQSSSGSRESSFCSINEGFEAICPVRHIVTHRAHPKSDKGYLGHSRWRSMTDPMTPLYMDLKHPSLNQCHFTSSPLLEDIEVTGYPTVILWAATVHARSNGDDAGDVFASLQCIEENGDAAYVTEGCLRIKHRHFFREGEANPVSDDLHEHTVQEVPGLPRRSYRKEYGISGALGSLSKPELLWFSLQPTSFLFKRGQCIRLAIYCADVLHFRPCVTVDYDLKLWIGDSQSSNVDLALGSRLLLPTVPATR